MSSTQQGSNKMSDCKQGKTDKSRRSWTMKEESTLLVALRELVVQGWKSDNGFRAGYLNKLESAMKKAFPGTDLKGVPHINSKICAWKKNYNSLSMILGDTGVGFNVNGDHMIDCTNEQWEHIMNRDPNARGMRLKSWPLLDQWKEVFGKDRATGEHAEDLMDAVNDMHRRDTVDHAVDDGEYHVNLDDIVEEEGIGDSISQEQKGEAAAVGSHGNKRKASDELGSGKSHSKKRKASNEVGSTSYWLEQISRDTNDRLKYFASRIGFEFDLSKTRKEVFELVRQIPGLSLEEIFDVGELLVYKVERLELFLGLPAEARLAYAMRLLQGRSK